MAFLHGDSFDHYATADAATYGWTFTNATIAAGGRNGSNALYVENWFGPASALLALPSNYETLVVGFGLKLVGLCADTFLLLRDAGTVHLDLRLDATDHIVVTRNGTVLQTSAHVPVAGSWLHVGIKTKIGDGTSGTWQVWANGVEIAKDVGGGDTRNGANAYINQILFNLNANSLYVDDLYVLDTSGATCNDFLGDIRGISQFANADGSNVAWTPSVGDRHDCVSKVTPTADAKYISHLTPTGKCSFSFPALGITGNVKAVVTDLYGLKDDAGSRSIREYCKSGATEATGDTFGLSDSGLYYRKIREVDPATSAAWLVAGVDAAEAGVELVS